MQRSQNQQWMFLLSLMCIFLINAACSSSAKKELSGDEKKAAIYYGYGTTNLMEKDYTSALRYLLLAIELNPKDSKIHNNLGMAYYFKKQDALAIEHIKKSLEMDPKNSDARNNLASIYYSLKKYEEAQKEYLTVLQDLIYDKQFRILFNLGLISQNLQRSQEALQYFKKSIVDNPNYCPAHFKIGEWYFQQKEYKKAYDSFHNASLGQCVDEPAPQYYQAVTLLKMGDLPLAKGVLTDFVSRFSDSQYSLRARQKLEEIPDYVEIKRSSHTHTTSSKSKGPNDLENALDESSAPKSEFLPYKEDKVDFTKNAEGDKTQ